jgi:hypothetical protein
VRWWVWNNNCCKLMAWLRWTFFCAVLWWEFNKLRLKVNRLHTFSQNRKRGCSIERKILLALQDHADE